MKNNNNSDNPLIAEPHAAPSSARQSGTQEKVRGWTESSSDWTTPPSDSATPFASPKPVVLEASDLDVRFGNKPVLQNISFKLHQGDTLGLLGLNGAGKSTLLNVLAGALAPENGLVTINEHELYRNTIAPRMEIGYAPDKPAIYPEFKVTEYLQFIARMRRIEKSRIRTCIEDVIERCALGKARNRIIGNLSSGYQQRVNIAQALIHTPRILILDEPANGLDPVQLMEMRQLVANLAPQQATIFSSHLLPEVNSICNRVILIHNGRQVLNTTLSNLSPQYSHAFEVHLQHPCQIDLQELPGVSEASSITADHWLVAGVDINAAHIATMLQSRGIEVTDIVPADNYLENLFQRLASTERDDTQHLSSNQIGSKT